MNKQRGWSTARRWLQASGAEFWLSLQIVAIAFWFGSNLLRAQELQRPHPTDIKLRAEAQLEATVSLDILLINATINRRQGTTQVEVRTTEPILKRLELELPLTDTTQIEAAIAQELGLSQQQIRQFVRYELVE